MIKRLTSGESCSNRTKAILIILLTISIVIGAYVYFTLPQVAETFVDVDDKTVLLIHADWCGHCRTLLETGGTWEQLKQQLPGITFKELEESQATADIEKYAIKGFPDIRIVDSATGRNSVQYTGARDVPSLKTFIMKNIAVIKAH